ncbi:MAG TPA: lytic transglycosylase domain-containing protein [Longimicrobiales bacterium]|nr:lytic transglycosylase domain-containing protein [Longimicrobiales bacterium]
MTMRTRNAVWVATGAALITVGFSVSASSNRTTSLTASAPASVAVGSDASAAPAISATRAGLGPEWDLPNVDHPRIDYWVARFDTVPAMRKKFQGFLDRGGAYAPMILEKLAERGMPQDLLYLAMIESGFQPNATSHAAAVGVWQFISETGQRYGLDIDRAVDERRDPVLATEAALDYLEDLHDRFGSWYLAAAAYNSGEGRVGRSMRAEFGRERAKSESEYYEIWDRLPSETRDYVPLMIAAARITKDPEAYGFRPMQLDPLEWEEIMVEPATQLGDIAATYGTTVSELKVLNPHFKLNRTPNNRTYTVRVPVGATQYAQASGSDLNVAD